MPILPGFSRLRKWDSQLKPRKNLNAAFCLKYIIKAETIPHYTLLYTLFAALRFG